MNAPDKALKGCTTGAIDSCNLLVTSGVMVQSGSKYIRFFTLTDNENGTFTYSDGETEVVLTEAELFNWIDNFIEPEGVDFQTLAYGYGYHTDSSVIPAGGTATYEGGGSYHTDSHLHDDGASILEVDFSTATVDLTLNFEGAARIDRIEAPNMLIDGYSFTGDEVNLYLGDSPVDLTGANSDAASAGIFVDPIDEEHLVPDWFVAVGVVEGDDDALWFSASGEAFDSAGIPVD